MTKLLEIYKEIQPYYIFQDMDGCITDFDKRFEEFSGGISPEKYEQKYGREKFWELIDVKVGYKFWSEMPWMPEGKKLWDYVKPFSPSLLSAPSKNYASRYGKKLWVQNNIPGTKLILASRENKKNYSGKNKILIDDRQDNISEWKSRGGIGILFKSTDQTINELKNLGI